jgi:hypothetical protein
MKLLTNQCPECNKQLEEIVQEYPARYNLKAVYLYTCWNKSCKVYGTTWSAKTWVSKYPDMEVDSHS